MLSAGMDAHFELGLDTFGDVTVDRDGRPVPQPQFIREVGEHHREDFAVSAPEVVLAAIAGRTEHIKLGSAVTVLSSDDPVRVFQRFATLDAVSSGRAEVILGRGSFTESFPLFGHDLGDYGVLFEEKLDLFARLLEEGPVTWSGTTRSPLVDQRVFPTTTGGLRTWVGVGGSPASVVRAARHGLPLVLAVIGGDPLRFAPFADLYRGTLAELGRPQLPIAVHSPGHVAATDEEAKAQLWPHYKVMHDRIGAQRGWPPLSRVQFEGAAGPTGALAVGAPETVARKVVRAAKGLGAARFDLKFSAGTLPHELQLASIERFATEVAPLVREEMARHEVSVG